MNKTKLNKVISEGNIVIPIYILKCFKQLDLTMEEFIFLMYLSNKQDSLDFNPEKIADDLSLDIMEVMGYMSVLVDKMYITLEVKKSDNNILEEYVSLSNFYERISMFLINSEEKKEDNLYGYVEHELGRPLNSVEISTIKGWESNNISGELIKEAIKITLDDGVYSLKYIDKILFDWHQRGFRTIADINNKFEDKGETKDPAIDLDLDWNWLDDEEYIAN